MSEEAPTDFAELASELAALRRAVVELGLAQAEALNALAEFVKTGGAPYGPPRSEIAGRVLSAAEESLSVVGRLTHLDDR